MVLTVSGCAGRSRGYSGSHYHVHKVQHLSILKIKSPDRSWYTNNNFNAGKNEPIIVKKDNVGFHLIQQIRDEAHRFAISGHRAKRAKKRITSSLEDIEGIGSQKRKNLLVYFGGIERIKNASIEEIIMVDGIDKKLAEKIYDYFH